jgi:hypothetical protein
MANFASFVSSFFLLLMWQQGVSGLAIVDKEGRQIVDL